MNITKRTITASITYILKRDGEIVERMSTLSRQLLEYVPDTGDIASVNRLIGSINSVKRQHLIKYFRAFLPWNFNEDTGQFSVKSGKRDVERKAKEVQAFLSDEHNNFYTWSRDNTTVKDKTPDYVKNFTSLVDRALSEEKRDKATKKMVPNKHRITVAQMIKGLVASNQLTAQDMLAAIEELQESGALLDDSNAANSNAA